MNLLHFVAMVSEAVCNMIHPVPLSPYATEYNTVKWSVRHDIEVTLTLKTVHVSCWLSSILLSITIQDSSSTLWSKSNVFLSHREFISVTVNLSQKLCLKNTCPATEFASGQVDSRWWQETEKSQKWLTEQLHNQAEISLFNQWQSFKYELRYVSLHTGGKEKRREAAQVSRETSGCPERSQVNWERR